MESTLQHAHAAELNLLLKIVYCIYCYRLQIIKTTTSVIKLVKAAISRYTGHNLSDNMCSRVELVLIMLSKTSDFIDEGIISLMNKDWNLHTIVHDLIVKLTFAVKFGGYYGHRDDYRREIKVSLNFDFKCG